MAIEGQLKEIDLATLLQTLKAEGQEGILYLNRSNNKPAKLYLSKDGIRYLTPETGDFTDLIEVILRHRIVKRDQIEEYKKKYRQRGEPLGKLLFQEGLISEDQMENIISPWFAEVVYNLFDWKEGTFRFVKSPPDRTLEFFDPNDGGLFITFDLGYLNLELVRRRDEWNKMRELIPSDECIFVMDEEKMMSESFNPDDYPQSTRKILRLLDGKKNVAQLREHSGLSSFDTYTILYELYSKGYIKLLDVSYLLEEAEELFQEDRIYEGMQRYKAAVQVNPNNIELRLSFAQRCEERGDVKEGAEQYGAVANLYSIQGKTKKAAQYFKKALQFDPENLHLSEQYFFFLLEKNPEGDETRTCGDEVAQELFQKKEYKRAAKIYEALREEFSGDLDCRQKLFHIYKKMRKKEKISKICEEMADIYLARGDYENAYKNYELVCKFDKSRKDIAQKMKGLEQFLSLASKGKGSKRILWALVYLFIISGWSYAIYTYVEFKYRKPQGVEATQLESDLARSERKIKEMEKLFARKNASQEVFEGLKKIEAEVEKKANLVSSYFEEDPGYRKLNRSFQNLLGRIRKMEARATDLMKKENYRLFQKASDLEEKQKLEGALKVYQQVASSPFNRPEVAGEAKKKVALLESKISSLKEQRQEVQKAIEAQKFEEALRLALDLLGDFPHTATVREMGYPLLVETLPPGAKIFIGDQVWKDKTPTLLFLPLTRRHQIRIASPGFKPFECTLQLEGRLGKDTQIFTLSNSYNFSQEKMSRLLKDSKLELVLEKSSLWKKRLVDARPLEFYPTSQGVLATVNRRENAYRRAAQVLSLEYWSGNKNWDFATQGESSGGSVGSWRKEKRLYLTSRNSLYALNISSGSPQVSWMKQFDRTLKNVSQVSFQGILTVTDERGIVYAIHPQGGRDIWKFPTNSESNGPPLVQKSSVVLVCRDGRLFSFWLEGGLSWTADLAEPTEALPYLKKGRLYVGTDFGKIIVLDSTEGKVLWQHPRQGSGDPVKGAIKVWQDQVLFITFPEKGKNKKGILGGLHKKTGKKLWQRKLPLTQKETFQTYLYKDYLFFGQGKNLWVYQLRSSQPPQLYWKTSVTTEIVTEPRVVSPPGEEKKILLLGAKKGWIYGWNW